MQDLLGVVLCGGGSKRMGTDKGLMPIEGTIRALYIADKLSQFQIPVIYSVNKTQVEPYTSYIFPDKLVVDSVDVKGPLIGLLSVHQKYPQRNLLLLACDILDLDGNSIQKILDVYEQLKEYDFYVYQDTEFAQPFCGIYTARGLKQVLDKAKEHTLGKFSFQKVLDDGNTMRLPIDNIAAFKNYNLPE